MKDEEFYLEIVKRHCAKHNTEYIDEGIFVNEWGMYHLCNPKAVVIEGDGGSNGGFNFGSGSSGVSFTVTGDAELMRKSWGNLYKDTLKCNKCDTQISKSTVMVALLRGKGQKWLG
jgi:hypothetical protein